MNLKIESFRYGPFAMRSQCVGVRYSHSLMYGYGGTAAAS
jgi:hypothetical protein